MITELKIINKLLVVISMLLLQGTTATERWSRQLQSAGFQTATSASNDWIPLTQPSSSFRSNDNAGTSGQNDRTSNGRVLNFQPHPHHQPPFAPHIFTSNGNVQHQPAPQYALVHGEPFSLLGQRFVVPQQQGPISQFQQIQQSNGGQPLPQYQIQKVNQQQQNQIKQQSFANQQQYQIVGQQVQQQPQQQKLQQQQLHIQPPRQQQVQYQTLQVQQPQQTVSSYPKEQTAQQYVEEQLAARQKPNFIEENLAQSIPQVESLIQSQPILHYSEQQTINKNNQQQVQPKQQSQNQQQPDEEVQLLYVPLDALYQQKNQAGFQNGKYNVLQQLNPAHINDFYTQLPPATAIPTTTSTTTTTTTTTSPHKQFSSSRGNFYRGSETISTTAKPKAHQPPLAMYMFNEKQSADSSVNDVLTTLRKTKTISVLDSLSSQTSPKVFVGPSGLKTPDGYSKFDLPYLSSIDHNRFERRVENLPFFVAPLSYRAPEGFEKIPLPAPHVGSVIVNIPSNTIETNEKQSYKQSTFISNTKKPAFFPTEEPYNSPVTQSYSNYFTDASPVNNINKNHEQFTTGAPREYFTTPSQVYNSFSPTYETHSTYTPQTKYEQYDIEQEVPTIKTFPPRNTSRSQTRQRPLQNQKTFSSFNTQVINEEYFNVQKPQENSLIQQQQEAVTDVPVQHFSHQPEPSYTKLEAQPKTPLESYVPDPSTPHYDDFGLSTAISSLKWAEQSTASPKRGNHFTKVQEEQRMKTYFRDQPAFKNRQGISSTTTTTQAPPSSYEQISYSTTPSYIHSSTPSSLNYQQSDDFAPMVSSQAPIQTPTEYSFKNEQSTQRANYYEPFNQQQAKEDYSFRTREPLRTNSNQKIEQTQSVHKFKFVDSVRPGYSHSTTVIPTTTDKPEKYYEAQDQYKNVNYPAHNSEQENNTDKKTINKYKYNLNSDQTDYSVKPLITSTVPPVTSPVAEQSTFNYPQEETYYQTPQYVEYSREPNQKQSIPKSSVYTPLQETTQEENKENFENVYEKNPYHLPSELPPLNANLPGLVNSLMEFDKTEEKEVPTTTTTTTRTVIPRRPLNRGRRPPPTRSSTSTTEATTRRVVQRGRRPLLSRPLNTEYNSDITSTTSQTTPSRSTIVRNPNRIRYNPSTEERRNYRPRSRNNNGVKNKEEENLEYQRDVLKQNYPVIKTTIQTTTDLPAVDTAIINNYSENLNKHHYNSQYDTYYQETREQQPIVNNEHTTSRNNFEKSQEELTTLTPLTDTAYHNVGSQKEHFVGLNEPMQLPQEYYNTNDEQIEQINEQQDNYPSYYQDSQKVINGNKITTSVRPVYVQSTTPASITTTIEPIKFRRPGPAFVRRPGRPINPSIASTTYATTTTYSDSLNQDKYTIRPKSRLDAAQRQTRIRSRIRKPITTTTEEPEEVTTTNNYYQKTRYQNDFYTESPKNDEFKITVAPYEDRTQHSRFRLEGQESQWSTKLTQNSFRPIDLDIKGKSLKDIESSVEEIEPEIITAGYEELDTFTVNVTPGKKTLFDENSNNVYKPKNKTEITLDEIVDQMTLNEDDKLSKNSNEILEELKNENKLDENKENSRRRGIWRRVRVRPIDQFETAESQNIGQHLINTVLNEKTNKNLNSKHVLNDKPKYNFFNDVTNDKANENESEIQDSAQITTVPSVNNNDSSEELTATAFENATDYPVTSTNNPDVEEEIITTISPNLNDEKELNKETETTTLVLEPENEVKEINEESTMTLTTQPPIMDNDYIDSETTTENSDDIKSEDNSSSMFDEVKQKLVDLFFSNDSDDEFDYHEVLPMTKQEYTSIERSKLLNEEDNIQTTTELQETPSITETSVSPKDPMGSLILATSTSKEISHETEICYRGRCIKTDMKKN